MFVAPTVMMPDGTEQPTHVHSNNDVGINLHFANDGELETWIKSHFAGVPTVPDPTGAVVVVNNVAAPAPRPRPKAAPRAKARTTTRKTARKA